MDNFNGDFKGIAEIERKTVQGMSLSRKVLTRNDEIPYFPASDLLQEIDQYLIEKKEEHKNNLSTDRAGLLK